MFERGVSDSRRKRIPVAVTLQNGSVIRGYLLGAFGNIGDILSDNSSFLEIVNARGDTAHFYKSTIQKIEPNDRVSADQLKKSKYKASVDTPYAVLGVEPDATEAQLAESYYRLSKTYHPDRLSALDLPPEMIAYGAAMQSRINSAFAEARELTAGNNEETDEEAPKIESQTVYEHRPHWVRSEAA